MFHRDGPHTAGQRMRRREIQPSIIIWCYFWFLTQGKFAFLFYCFRCKLNNCSISSESCLYLFVCVCDNLISLWLTNVSLLPPSHNLGRSCTVKWSARITGQVCQRGRRDLPLSSGISCTNGNKHANDARAHALAHRPRFMHDDTPQLGPFNVD